MIMAGKSATVRKASKRKSAAAATRSRKSTKIDEATANQPLFKCPYCRLEFMEESVMLAHKEYHEEEYQFECGQCDKLFKDLQSLKHHFYFTHITNGRQGGVELESSLPVIEGEFLVKEINRNGTTAAPAAAATQSSSTAPVSKRKRTRKSQSSGVQNVKQENLPFVDNNANASDVQAEDSSLNCPECNQLFQNKKALTDHQKTHDPDYEFVCQITGCEKLFKTRHDRNRHEVRAHVPVDQRPNQIFCEICNKRLAHRGVVKDHMRTHTGERPFTCHLCGKSFRQASALRDHLQSKMHGGEGMSHRNKKKVKKAIAEVQKKRGPKKKLPEKVEQDSYDEYEGSEVEEEETSQSGSSQINSIEQQPIQQVVIKTQTLLPPTTVSPRTKLPRSMPQLQAQYTPQSSVMSGPGSSSGQHPMWKMQQQHPPQQLVPNTNANMYQHQQRPQQFQQQLVQQQTQSQTQTIFQSGTDHNVILHMPTLTLHDPFENVYTNTTTS